MGHALGLALQGRFNDPVSLALIIVRFAPATGSYLPDLPDALLVPAGVVEENGHQISDFGTTALRQRQTSKPRLDLYCSDLGQFVLPPVRKNPAGQVRLVSLLG